VETIAINAMRSVAIIFLSSLFHAFLLSFYEVD
jgi:hypothetical protein